MNQPYLQITFRGGRAVAAYYYLPRHPGQRSARTLEHSLGILVDYADEDSPIGIEITDPKVVSLEQLNAVLRELRQTPLTGEEFAPLKAA